MSLSTFEYKIYLLAQNISLADTVFRGVPIEKRAEIRRLSTGNSFRTISKAFGTGKSTVIKLFNELLSELVWMSENLIRIPKTNLETGAKIRSFSNFTGCEIP